MKRLACRKLLPVVLLCAALLTGSLNCARVPAQQGVAAAPPPTSIAVSEAAKRREAFEVVWTTVKQQFYDPTFGGVDWDEVHNRYAPLVAAAKDDQTLYALLQAMLNELHQSHFLIIPPEAIPQFPPADDDAEWSDETEEGTDAGPKIGPKGFNYKLTEQLTTGIGIDLRLIDGAAVVTRVEPGSSAARAGLRPGFIIKQAGGKSFDKIITEAFKHPMYRTLLRPEMPLLLLAGYINGESRSPVQLLYLDGRNRMRRVRIAREKLSGEMSPPVGNLPATYTEFESRVLPGGFGYVRFNAFVPPLMEKLCGAIHSLRDAPGLVIDLRGNQGGLLGMIGGLSGLLDPRQISLGTMQTRGGSSAFYTFPQKFNYKGLLAILTDGSTQSAGEIFASGMQENARAIIVGERTAGNTLPSVIKELPTGALFQYGFANFRTSGGMQLEGRGVIPNFEVRLSRRALLGGRDPQLETSVQLLRRMLTGEDVLANAQGRRAEKNSLELIGDPSGAVVRRIEVDPPPPPPPPPPPAPKASAPLNGLQGGDKSPTVEQILGRYIEARGGKIALEKLTSRVMKATIEITSMNLSGTAQIYEKAPNKSVWNINVNGLGQMQRGFDGSKGWWQDSLRGYIQFTGYSLTEARREADFYKDLKFNELYNRLRFSGLEKVSGRDAYVIQEIVGGIVAQSLSFDVATGLLLRKDKTYYEDYREVDGVRLPFVIREETDNGFSFIYHITEVRQNVAIDDATFVEFPSCFNRQ